jgi:hypothetical protein
MVRRVRHVIQRLLAPLVGVGLLGLLAGCLGGAQPVPPALEPTGVDLDGSVDLARGGYDGDGGSEPDANAAPPSTDCFAGVGEADPARDAVGAAAGVDWHWRTTGSAPWAVDAGVPIADAAASGGDAADAP